jgi:hypothetical protein
MYRELEFPIPAWPENASFQLIRNTPFDKSLYTFLISDASNLTGCGALLRNDNKTCTR